MTAHGKSNEQNGYSPILGVGIDFGTSKSAIATVDNLSVDDVNILQVRKRRNISNPGYESQEIYFFPSFVTIEIRDSKRLLFNLLDQVGPLRTFEDSAAFTTMNFKLLIGKEWSPEDRSALEKSLPNFASPLPRPEELAGCMLYRLRESARPYNQNNKFLTDRCVIAIPPGWTYKQRQATIYAAHMAGLEDVEIIEEPVSSLIGVKSDNTNVYSKGLHLVIDFGAGTCDIALIERREDQHYAVLDSDSGDNLGGRNIDEALLKWIIDQSSYHIDTRRKTISGNGLSPNRYTYYRALWQIEKWKVINNTYFRSQGVKPERIFVPGLSLFSEDSREPLAISKNRFAQIVEEAIEEKFSELLHHVLNNVPKERLRNVKSILLTGGSSQLIGFQDLVKRGFAEISNMALESVDNLILEADDPQWSVVRGAALVSYGLTTRSQIISSELRSNVHFVPKNEKTDKDLKLIKGDLQIKGRSAGVHLDLPFADEFVIEVNEDAPALKIEIYKGAKARDLPVDELTITAAHGHKMIPSGTRIKLKYHIRRDETIQVDSCLIAPKLKFAMRHNSFHHTALDGKYTTEISESREKFGLVPGDEDPPENANWEDIDLEYIFFYLNTRMSSINWSTRAISFVATLVITTIITGIPILALIVASVLAIALPNNIDLIKLVLELAKDMKKNL